jgi:hypothetical protein
VEGKHVESRRHRRPRQVSCCTAQGRVVSMQTACALCTRSCSTQCTGMLQTACVSVDDMAVNCLLHRIHHFCSLPHCVSCTSQSCSAGVNQTNQSNTALLLKSCFPDQVNIIERSFGFPCEAKCTSCLSQSQGQLLSSRSTQLMQLTLCCLFVYFYF